MIVDFSIEEINISYIVKSTLKQKMEIIKFYISFI